MPRNPFRRKSRADRLREKATVLSEQADLLREKAAELSPEGTRERARELQGVIGERAEQLAEPLPARGRRPLLVVVLVGGAAVAIAFVRRRSRSATPEAGVPAPTVTPTAPAGPTDPELNDPALKAKVESELFAAERVDVPKEKVSVGVADGVVTLRGRLDSVEQTTTLTEAAEQIDGVRRVENLMSVEPSS
jgi:translation elongation factor EF-1beta